MPQSFTRRYTDADLKPKPKSVEPALDLTPVDDDQLDLTPVGWDSVDLTNKGPLTVDKMGRKIAPVTVDPLKQDSEKPEWSFSGPDFLNALKEVAIGTGKAGLHLGQALSGNPQNALKDAQDTIAGTRQNFQRAWEAPSNIEKVGRFAALPLDLFGAPVTQTAEDIISGNYGAALAHGGLSLLTAKGVEEFKSPRKTISPLNVGEMGTKAFNEKMPLAGTYFDKTPEFKDQGNLPYLEGLDNVPTHQQPGLDFGSKPTPNRGQAPLDFSPLRGEPVQQGLDLVGVPSRLPNEFMPDQSYLNQSPIIPPRSLFEKPNLIETIDKERPGWSTHIEQMKDKLETPSEENIFPQEMRATEKPENVALGGASERGLNILGTTLYSEDRPTIAAKELLQNAVDEHRLSGTKEPIRFLFDNSDPIPGSQAKDLPVGHPEDGRSITIADKGRGVSKEQIYTVLTNMFESGKGEEAGASGGFGIAKAAPMMGGRYAKFESVVVENGQKVKYTFEGSPADLKNQKQGVPLKREIVGKDRPTGLRAKVWYDNNTYLSRAKEKIQAMGEHSMNNESPIEVSETYGGATPADIEDYLNGKPIKQYSYFKDHPAKRITQSSLPKLQDTIKIPGVDIDIHYNTPTPNDTAQSANVRVANNGLHQFDFEKRYSFRGALRNVPSELKFNVKPNVAEGMEGYPFTANREQLQADTLKAVNDWIDKNIISGAMERQKQSLRDMYQQMKPLSTHGTGTTNKRPTVIYDPNNALSTENLNQLTTNPFVNDFADMIDNIIHQAIEDTNPEWHDKIEKTGITLDPNVHGIWIPDPDARGKKATILINPFINITRHSPLEAARENLATIWHEVAHTGQYNEFTKPIDWSKVDTTDPEIGQYFQKYINEVSHGNNVQDASHGLDFLRNAAEVYAKSGTEAWSNSIVRLEEIFTNGKPGGGYTPDVQDALSVYNERTRNTGTERDILSGTGINSESTRGGKESISSDVGSSGKRPVRPEQLGKKLTSEFSKRIQPDFSKPTPEVVNKIQQEVPQNRVPNRIQNVSDQLEQAKKDPNITKDEKENIVEKALNFQRTLLTSYDVSAPGRQGLSLIHRKEWWSSWKPMLESYGSEKAYNTVMESIQQDPSGFFRPNEKGKSFANEAGLELTDRLTHREEIFRSKWAEDWAPGVKASVRAYTAYLNKLRADSFKNMVKEAGAENNIVVAKQIADFINVATGRGSLGAFEPAAKPLAQIFFSPRLTASRLQMYTRTLNPKFYADMPPVVRKNQLKSALSLAGTGILIGKLAEMAGATVNGDPTNSDYGKIRFGNTRIDPFAGHQQFLVAAARMLTGKTTSSTTNKTTSLTSGKFGMPTRASVFGNFMKNKLAPVPSFVWSWMEGKDFDGTPFDAKREMLNRTVPIVMQDLHDIWKEDPALFAGLLASLSATTGGGVQTYGR